MKKVLSIVTVVCILLTLCTQVVFAEKPEQEYGVMPMMGITSLTYTLAPGESKTTYKYSVSSSCWNVSAGFDIQTPGGSISATLYGANSTSTANHSVASGSGIYGTNSGMDGEDLYLSSSNSYPMYCVNVRNTSTKTITVSISLSAD